MTAAAPDLPSATRWGLGAAALIALGLLISVIALLLVTVAVISGVGHEQASSTGLRDGTVPPELAPVFAGAAALCGLPPSLLAAQARQESGFRNDARSSAGAVGVMQFLPATWASVGFDASGDGRADPTDPVDAIYSGARYDCRIREQLRRSGLGRGDLDRLTLAAYNAGPAVVEQCRCVPAYAETQSYVANIVSLESSMQAPASGPAVVGQPGQLAYPLAARAVPTSPFGWRRSPTTGASELHAGQDLAAPAGTAVLAATAGVVTTAGWTGGYGNYVCVDRDQGFRTCYGHLAAIAVHAGQNVGQGQQVAFEGSTGNVTGPHLHFEVRLDGVPTDPIPYLPGGR